MRPEQIAHVLEYHEVKHDQEGARRKCAESSWLSPIRRLYKYPRSLNSLPFLRDVIQLGIDSYGPFMLTNDDTVLHPSLWNSIHPGRMMCSQRVEVPSDPDLSRPVREYSSLGYSAQKHPGRDWFFFPKGSIRAEDVPDMVLGGPYWDIALGLIVRIAAGFKGGLDDFRQPMWPSDLPLGYVLHVSHQNHWNDRNRPEYVHNKAVMTDWLRSIGVEWSDL